jgi:hypothetical protein
MFREAALLQVFLQRLSRQIWIRLFTEETESAQLWLCAHVLHLIVFRAAYYAGKFAMEHMMPVIFLSEGYLGNGNEPWKIPSMKDFPSITPPIVNKVRWQVQTL